ncbi:MAG: hypothetical protein HYX42_04025 [Polaromonas sp.]|uniref:hypothetical protein n=1 Tax=Polaromonas sp. TaxID=1869339 RepID=UPI0025ED0D09|nr:hypothetical protein [Polaromonas sp.]MBI2725398.1 hypothetical protein [Polaromonas sp.]
MSNFDFPSNTPVVDDKGSATVPWMAVFSRWQTIISSGQDAGVTADRPTNVLWIGRRYFDQTLGKPVYLKSVRPSVWVDGVGTVC